METLQKIGLNQIHVTGYFRNLLISQATGLTGNMEEIFPDVGPNSAWLCGNGESWERGPYYIDGLFTLAFAIFDSKLLKKSRKWIEAIVRSQEPNGNFGPKSNNDWWPRFVVIKALTNVYYAENNKTIIKFIEKYLDYMD